MQKEGKYEPFKPQKCNNINTLCELYITYLQNRKDEGYENTLKIVGRIIEYLNITEIVKCDTLLSIIKLESEVGNYSIIISNKTLDEERKKFYYNNALSMYTYCYKHMNQIVFFLLTIGSASGLL